MPHQLVFVVCATALVGLTALLAVNWANRQADRAQRRERNVWQVALARKKFNVAHARWCADNGWPLTEEQKKMLGTGV